MKRSRLFVSLSFALALGSTALPAMAQSVPTTAPTTAAVERHGRRDLAPASVQGRVARLIVAPFGAVRGFTLDSGTVVYAPRRGTINLGSLVSVGQVVRVSGFATPGSPGVILRPTIADASGRVLFAPMVPSPDGRARMQAQRGRAHDPQARIAHRAQALARLETLPVRSAQGRVETVLAGRGGNVRGLILSDGTSVLVPREIAAGLRQHAVRAGDQVAVQGRGASYPHGASVVAAQVRLADGTVLAASR